MGTKKKKKKKNQIEGADCKHLLSEPGDGGLSKFSLLSGRGNTILWQKEIAQKQKISEFPTTVLHMKLSKMVFDVLITQLAK